MTKERLIVIIQNFVKYLDTEFMEPCLTVDEKLDLLKKEMGFTDEEIENLNIVEECLKIF